MNSGEINRFRENLTDERNGAALYRAMAEAERNPKIAELYQRLAAVEDRHADTWAERLRDAGVALPPFRLSWRTRMFSLLARRFGVDAVLPSLATLEDVDSHAYSQQPDAVGLVPDERLHARLLRQITQPVSQGSPGVRWRNSSGVTEPAGETRSAPPCSARAMGSCRISVW